MPRFAANVSLMYTEHGFLERFAAAKKDGFDAVECQFPYAFDKDQLAAKLRQHKLTLLLINAPPGNLEAGERGIACLADRVEEFRCSFLDQALPYAKALHCLSIHVMAGVIPGGTAPEDLGKLDATFRSNLAWAAARCAPFGIHILIEPINTRDIPRYFLNNQDHAHSIVESLGIANLHVQMDLYHVQIVEGDLATKLRTYLSGGRKSRVRHLQIAGVPSRQEPDHGEVNFPFLFDLIDELGYDGYIGCEYKPRAGTSEGLSWMRNYNNNKSISNNNAKL